ncbi:MAG: SET domain-containing protein-lysine N-methyltransferase [Planctomycetales bacterium]
MQSHAGLAMSSSEEDRSRSHEDIWIDDTPVGKGVFAGRPYPVDSIIGEITGQLMDDPDYTSEYCIDIEQGRQLEPDAPFRFLNHCCEPNCELEWSDLLADSQVSSQHRVFVIALQDIQAGEELTIDYHWPAEAAIPCYCESPNCRGWIADEFLLENCPPGMLEP